MEEEATRVEQPVSIEVSAKFEAIQDEVDLLKNEIKQTLVDLREFMMKGRTISRHAPVSTPDASSESPAAVDLARQPTPPPDAPPPVAAVDLMTSAALQGFQMSSDGTKALDTTMLGKIITWLGSVTQMGLSMQQITSYLQVYEASGYLQPTMVKVILQSMAGVDPSAVPAAGNFSPDDYAACVGQLHEIIGYLDAGGDSEPTLAKRGMQKEPNDATTPERYLDSSGPHHEVDLPKKQAPGVIKLGGSDG